MLRFPRSRAMLALASCASLAAALAWASPARANGRFPAANQLVVAAQDPSYLILRTTFGIMFSHDRGQNWDWVCEKAVGYGGLDHPSMGITKTGRLAGPVSGLAGSPA